jgi:aspartyl-tRNA(Asn)/glutamyl-tRNA(Gln) amidotransferase subunit C
MPKLDKKVIKQLTQLCRIDCTEEEQEDLLRDLKKILAYVEQLQEIDTEDVPPCDQVLEEMKNVMRDDVIGSVLDRDEFLANAPARIGSWIRVPRVIKPSQPS